MIEKDLASQHCIPCEGNIKPLSREDAETILVYTPGWTMSDDAKVIARDFVFKDFKDAMIFVNKVAAIAESEGHHPDIAIVWNKVHLDLTTHAIRGLSHNDFVIAAMVNELT